MKLSRQLGKEQAEHQEQLEKLGLAQKWSTTPSFEILLCTVHPSLFFCAYLFVFRLNFFDSYFDFSFNTIAQNRYSCLFWRLCMISKNNTCAYFKEVRMILNVLRWFKLYTTGVFFSIFSWLLGRVSSMSHTL